MGSQGWHQTGPHDRHASPPRKPAGSSLQRLFKHMQLLVQLTVLGAVAANLAHRMQHGGVVTAAKQLADLGQAFRTIISSS